MKSRFLFDSSGNISIMFAFASTMLFVGAGAAIDYSNAIRMKDKLTTAVDAGLLAVAKVDLNGTNRQATFEKVMTSWLEASGIDLEVHGITFNADEALNAVDITASVTGNLGDSFLSGFGFPTMQVSASGGARHEATSLEISLVLDVSSSMKGQKLTDLVTATQSFLDIVMFNGDEQDEDISVGIVPYGGSVRLPSDIQDTVSLDTHKFPEFERDEWEGCIQYNKQDHFDDGLLSGTFEPIVQHWKWYNGNWWCPQNAIIPQSTDYNALVALSNSFALSDGTGTDHGILWGYKILSPDWRDQIAGGVSGRPFDYDEAGNRKIMVVMTDGGITAQFRPNQADLNHEEQPYQTYNSKDYNRNTARDNFHSICTQAKDNDVTIYTVGFNVNNSGNLADLQSCATSETHYFTPGSNELTATFEAIATDLIKPTLTN